VGRFGSLLRTSGLYEDEPGTENEAAYTLVVRRDDVGFVRAVTESSGLAAVLPEELCDALAEQARPIAGAPAGSEPIVTKAGFDSAIGSLLPVYYAATADDGLEEDRALLEAALSNIFYLYAGTYHLDQRNDGADDEGVADAAPLLDLAAGLALFCAGTKSAKLALIFKLFSAGSAGAGASGIPPLPPRALVRALRASLLALFGCAAQTLGSPATEAAAVAGAAAQKAARSIWAAQASMSRPTMVTFEQFGAWYNAEGYTKIPWIELLDLRKWALLPQAPVAPSQIQELPSASAVSSQGDAEAEHCMAAAAAAAAALQYALTRVLMFLPHHDSPRYAL